MVVNDSIHTSSIVSSEFGETKPDSVKSTFTKEKIVYSDSLYYIAKPAPKPKEHIYLPQYYTEIFFKNDSLFHPEINGGRYGIAGDPRPYQASNDDVITSTLLAFAIITVLVVSNSKFFISNQIKNLRIAYHGTEETLRETTGEVILQCFLTLQWCMLLALIFFNFTQQNISDTFLPTSEYIVIGIFILDIVGCEVIKNLIQFWVNITFFGSRKAVSYLHFSIFMTSMAGALLLPVMFVQIFYGLSIEYVLFFIVFLLTFVKIMAFYKSYYTFFSKNVVKLQNFLYFCTLEILPLLAMWAILMFSADILTIK